MSAARLGEISSLRSAIDKEVAMGDQEQDQSKANWLERRLRLRQQREVLSREFEQLSQAMAVSGEIDAIAKAKAEAAANVAATQKDREEVAALKAELAEVLAKAKAEAPKA